MSREAQPPPLDPSEPRPPATIYTPEGRGEPRWATAALLAALAVFVFLVRSILAPFVIAAILAYVFSPVVVWLEQRTKLPRAAAVALFVLALLVPIGVAVWIVAPTLAKETNDW